MLTRYQVLLVVRVLLSINSAMWLLKILVYATYPHLSAKGVLYWFISVEYIYLTLLISHVIFSSTNFVLRDRWGWACELEVVLASLISLSVVSAAAYLKSLNPESVTCLLLSLVVLFGYRSPNRTNQGRAMETRKPTLN